MFIIFLILSFITVFSEEELKEIKKKDKEKKKALRAVKDAVPEARAVPRAIIIRTANQQKNATKEYVNIK